MRSIATVSLSLVVLITQLPGAVRGDRAAYIGGTSSLKQGTQGRLDAGGPTEMVFATDGSTLKIPYGSVTSLEFGQKIGRRVGATIALGVTTLGIGALPVLFSKKKRHYLTIEYTENGANQAAVFELAKDIVRSTLATLEARTGRQVERDDTADLDKPKETTERTRTANSVVPPAPAVVAPQPSPTPTPTNTAPAQSATNQTPAAVMTNADIVKMVQAGVSQDLIIATIRSCQPQFSMLPAVLGGMTRAGVSAEIIKTMAAKANGRL
jgi:hypothetical protein